MASDPTCMSLEMIQKLIGGPRRMKRGEDHPAFLVSPPGAGFGDWFGEQKFARDAFKAVKHPRRALREWGRYADLLSQFADVFVIPYASHRQSSIWRMVYTANGPQILDVDGKLHALIPNLSHPGRQGEHRWHRDLMLRLGLPPERVLQFPCFQEGQADFSRPIERSGQKPLLFLGYGIRTPDARPYEWLRKKGLLKNDETVMIRMNPNSYAFHQDTWLNLPRNRQGEMHCLYCPDWIHPDDRNRFDAMIRSTKLPVIILKDADAKAYAANANEVSGNLFLVRGGAYEISAKLRRRLKNSGFNLIELDCDELYAKAGGGTRCMVNELRGISRIRHRRFFSRLEQFRYLPGSWRKIQNVYPITFSKAFKRRGKKKR